MADALESSRLSQTLNTPLWSPRLRDTPLRDLVRGRLTGRLDWRGKVRAAALPAPVAALVVDVVRRTRLWRIEQAAVADELIAHFADGLGSGTSGDELIRAFGDPAAAARLIRRAKRRNRPLAWHALKWTRRALVALLLLYAIVFARFAFSRPTVRVDYVAQLNAPTLARPEIDRAWPIYRRAILAMGLDDENRMAATIDRELQASSGSTGSPRRLIDATPADAEWPALVAWLDANVDAIASIRVAAAKPVLGYVYGPGGSQVADGIGLQQRAEPPESVQRSLMAVLLPYLNHSRQMGKVLMADARLARSRGDAARFEADVAAAFGIARQLRAPFLVEQYVGMGIANLALDEVAAALDDQDIDDATLVRLAHRVGSYGGDVPGSLLDPSGERASFRDVVQRLYSDDGRGDGHLTMTGARGLSLVQGIAGNGLLRRDERASGLEVVATTAALSTVSAVTSRRAVLAEYDRLFDLSAAQYGRPRRDWAGHDAALARVREIAASPVLLARYLPITILLPAVDRAAEQAERTLGQRDGVVVGIALEVYRRRHGTYPPTLDALAPQMLPRVPADRITGDPIRYRLIDGRPVVYSVGFDRDDDGGRAVDVRGHGPVPTAAAVWGEWSGAPLDGDWLLLDARPPRERERSTR